MPEPAEILRRVLDDRERNVLVLAARGGPRLVAESLSGVASAERAAELIDEVRAKARAAVASCRAGGGERSVAEAAMEVAGVAADEAEKIVLGAGHLRPPVAVPPTSGPAPSSRFARASAVPARRLSTHEVEARRERIVELLGERPMSQLEVAAALGVPIHTATYDLSKLGTRVARTGRRVPSPLGGPPSPEWGLADERDDEEVVMSTELVVGESSADVPQELTAPQDEVLSDVTPATWVQAETHDGVWFSYMALLFDRAKRAGCEEWVFDRIERQVSLGPPSARRTSVAADVAQHLTVA